MGNNVYYSSILFVATPHHTNNLYFVYFSFLLIILWQNNTPQEIHVITPAVRSSPPQPRNGYQGQPPHKIQHDGYVSERDGLLILNIEVRRCVAKKP